MAVPYESDQIYLGELVQRFDKPEFWNTYEKTLSLHGPGAWVFVTYANSMDDFKRDTKNITEKNLFYVPADGIDGLTKKYDMHDVIIKNTNNNTMCIIFMSIYVKIEVNGCLVNARPAMRSEVVLLVKSCIAQS